MIALSTPTRQRIEALFEPVDRDPAGVLLEHECGDNLPLLGYDPTPESLERVRFAAIRLSGGSLPRLQDAVAIARRDWRDLLVAGGFANRLDAHLRWQPRRLDAATRERWRGGVAVDGVGFEPGQHVIIVGGRRFGRHGRVIDLLALDPDPRYLVDVGGTEVAEVFQRILRVAPPSQA